MATKFMSLNSKNPKTTTFKFALEGMKIKQTDMKPSYFDNVLHIGYDEDYGDVFKCWNDGFRFTLYFGEAGDEFNNI